MGSSNPLDSIGSTISDAANTVMDGVSLVTPVVDRLIDPFDILPDSVRIPGTNLYISLASFLAGPIFGIPAIPFHRHGENNQEYFSTSSTRNPYFTNVVVSINGVKQDTIAFQCTSVGFNSVASATKFLIDNPSTSHFDVCASVQNTNLQIAFDDTDYTNNDGTINLAICYLGDTNDCNCKTNFQENADVFSIGFSTIDTSLTYPVNAHGIKYVGDKTTGLSTGGRCELSTLYNAIKEIENKYTNKYSVDFDDTQTNVDFEKNRVLDLVYKFNGNTWIRQQNLLESVYYHTGVGDSKSSIFFGGIHDSLTNYNINFDPYKKSDFAEYPTYNDFDFNNTIVTDILKDSLYGQNYPKILTDNLFWQNPQTWEVQANFANDIDHKLFDDYTYVPNMSSNYFALLNDSVMPQVSIISLYPTTSFDFGNTQTLYYQSLGGQASCNSNGSWRYGCTPIYVTAKQTTIEPEVISGATKVNIFYPTQDSVSVSANLHNSNAYKNNFLVKAFSQNITGNVVDLLGEITITDIQLRYPNKINILPNNIKTDATGNYFSSISGEIAYISLKNISTNGSSVNLAGVFQHQFNYSDVSDNISGYYSRGLFTLRFNSLNEIRDSIINNTAVSPTENFTIIDASTLPVTGAVYINGDASVKFENNVTRGIMIGIEDKSFNWYDSIENTSYDVASLVDNNNVISNVKIGNNSERWGVPLWVSDFTTNVNFNEMINFNSRSETSDSIHGTIVYDNILVNMESNSLMALMNNRIRISGQTKEQLHNYTAVNSIKSKYFINLNNTIFEQSQYGIDYDQMINFGSINESLCIETFNIADVISNISGSISSSGSFDCLSKYYTFPNNLKLTSISDTPVIGDDLMSHFYINYDYYDGNVNSANSIIVNSINEANNVNNYVTNLTKTSQIMVGCPETIAKTVVSGDISVNISGSFNTMFGTITGNKTTDYNFDTYEGFIHSAGSDTTTLSGGLYVTQTFFSLYDSNTWSISGWEYADIDYSCVDSTSTHLYNNAIPYYTDYVNTHTSYSDILNYICKLNLISNVYQNNSSNCCTGVISLSEGVRVLPNGNLIMPENNFIINKIDISNDSRLSAIVYYDVLNRCNTKIATFKVYLIAARTNIITINMNNYSAGTLTFDISTCENISSAENTIIPHEQNISILLSNISASNNYAEYATNIIQEYNENSIYKVPEFIVTSNDNNILTPNNGSYVNSKWRRYMDGVGFGGDAVNYDSVYNTTGKTYYPINNWSEIGYWTIGQMAFGSVTNAVVVGGHKISRNVGTTLFGSGLHASPTTKRVYIWNKNDIAEEDGYLKNYYGRRFNTFYTTETQSISSNQNHSTLDCILFQAESDIVAERIGTIHFDGTFNQTTIKFDLALDKSIADTYSITLTPNDNVKLWWSDKTVDGFTIHCELSNWIGSVDYLVSSVTKVTEDNLTNLNPEDGYNFKK